MECLQIPLDYRPVIGHSNLGLKNGGCWKGEGCASREIRVLGTECNSQVFLPSRGGNTCSFTTQTKPGNSWVLIFQDIQYWLKEPFFLCLAECCNSGNIHLKMNYVLEPGESIWPNLGGWGGWQRMKRITRVFFFLPS